MSAFNATVSGERGQLRWIFALFWVAVTLAGGLVYAFPVGAVNSILGLDKIDPARVGDLSREFIVLASVLTGAACGSTIAIGQWLLLRRIIKQAERWIWATIAGYASIGLLAVAGDVLHRGWINWSFTLINSGKMHWLARVQPEWTGSAWLPGAVTLTLFGIVLGIAQWFVLRSHVRQAGWWIGTSAAGWALVAGLSAGFIPWAVFVLASNVPAVVGGIMMVLLLRQTHSAAV